SRLDLGHPERERSATAELRPEQPGNLHSGDATAPPLPTGSLRVAHSARALLLLLPKRQSRASDVRHTRTIRRPRRARIAIHVRREPRDFSRRHFIHTDETVVGAITHKREPCPVG